MSEETPAVPEVSVTAAVPASPLTTIANLGKHEGARVTLHAWLYNLRAVVAELVILGPVAGVVVWWSRRRGGLSGP